MSSGRVFRVAELTDLRRADNARLAAPDLRLVIDFNATVERAHCRTRLATEPRTRDHDFSGVDLIRTLRDPPTTAKTCAAMMTRTYRLLMDEQTDAYAKLFRRIEDGHLPLVFHRAVGKDRSVIAAALLLDLLGVQGPPKVAVAKIGSTNR